MKRADACTSKRECSEIHLEDCAREAYWDLIAAKRASEQTQAEQRQALDALKHRRTEATDALLDVGPRGDEAERRRWHRPRHRPSATILRFSLG